MSGFLRGWLRGEPLETCCAFANANGAFAVSRLLCSAEYPTWAELSRFLERGSLHRALRHDETLNHIHWATTRRPAAADDHGAGDRPSRPAGEDRRRGGRAARAHRRLQAAGGRGGGEGRRRPAGLRHASRRQIRPRGPVSRRSITTSGSAGRSRSRARGRSISSSAARWAPNSRNGRSRHTIKCLCFYHPDDPPELKARQERELLRLHDAARTLGRELLIEIIASKHGPIHDDTIARVLGRLYAIGVRPDWWKLEGQASQTAWEKVARVIEASDPLCRGIVLLGLEAPEDDLAQAFAVARHCALVKGFAVGRTIFVEPALEWFAGRIDDHEAIERMADGVRAAVRPLARGGAGRRVMLEDERSRRGGRRRASRPRAARRTCGVRGQAEKAGRTAGRAARGAGAEVRPDPRSLLRRRSPDHGRDGVVRQRGVRQSGRLGLDRDRHRLRRGIPAGWASALWARPETRIPGGLCVAVAVSMAPLAIYGVQDALNLWAADKPGRLSRLLSVDQRQLGLHGAGRDRRGGVGADEVPLPVHPAHRRGRALVPVDGSGCAHRPPASAGLAGGLGTPPHRFEDFRPRHDRRGLDGRSQMGRARRLRLLAASLRRDDPLGRDQSGATAANSPRRSIAPSTSHSSPSGSSSAGAFMRCSARSASTIYLGHLAYDVFKDAVAFSFALSAIGLAIIFAGVYLERRRGAIDALY